MKVYEEEGVVEYLKARDITDPIKKRKDILNWVISGKLI